MPIFTEICLSFCVSAVQSTWLDTWSYTCHPHPQVYTAEEKCTEHLLFLKYTLLYILLLITLTLLTVSKSKVMLKNAYRSWPLLSLLSFVQCRYSLLFYLFYLLCVRRIHISNQFCLYSMSSLSLVYRYW